MRFAEIVAASDRAAATGSRTAKAAVFADLLRRAAPDEVEAVVGFLVGWPRQGKAGVGWAGAARLGDGGASVPELEVGDVDAALSRLAAVSGPGSQGERRALLDGLVARCTPAEARFVRRLLVGEVRHGALEGVVSEAVARAAGVGVEQVRRAAMLAGDLGVAARVALGGGAAALAGVGLDVGRAVSPMLAASSPGVADALAHTGPASVEWKLDGARIQAHRRNGVVRLFTRNLNEVTDRLPGIAEAVAGLPGGDLVLDGEAIGVDEADAPRRFQDTMSEFGRERPAGPAGRLQGWFFDLLHLDGSDLLDAPLAERRAALASVAASLVVPSIVTADPAEAEAFLGDALARGHEGVMVKALASPYDAGRRGGAWRKVKPVRVVDLVVLAAEWGSGRRRGWLSNLHLGARGAGGTFVMVGKTFKGLTDELLAWQTAALLAREVGRDGHVVHVRPELVVEIALDGVQVSHRYPGGVALRFARVRRYRDDKRPEDADPIELLQAMLARAVTDR